MSSTTLFDLGDVAVRKFRPDNADLTSLIHSANDTQVATYMTGLFPSPYTQRDALGFVYRCTEDKPSNFAIVDTATDAVIGCIGLKHFDDIYIHRKELGYWLASTHWGRGIMARVAKSFCQWAFEEYPDLQCIQAKAMCKNIQSTRVMEKAGFTFDGRLRGGVIKNGVTTDEMVYSVLKGEI
ncbi:hypothetical protein TD95_004349 [Thielaviopsis punctulata]|uniref:N-acetyltransferase domain-containing protein n=1 Tax=Thielaviopsis punctulata TaxID=72032 RepID=A0A0F4ZAY9_9PEZI|nr:hypothetical protein TD95_004349 [Thielaviopsis punctulata]